MSAPDDLEEDELLAKFIMLYKQTHHISSVGVLQEEAKEQPSSQLDCPTVPDTQVCLLYLSRVGCHLLPPCIQDEAEDFRRAFQNTEAWSGSCS